MPCACIDIGSNTIRLLVAEEHDGRLHELGSERAFTRIGRGLPASGRIPRKRIAEAAEVVEGQVRLADQLGARPLSVVATAAIRDARNRDELVDSIEARAGVAVEVLSEQEEARLSFLGATRTLGAPLPGDVAVVDVGGGSTEIAVGTLAGGVAWSESFRIGSGLLADAYLRSDPPAAAELNRVRQHVSGVFEGLEIPRPGRAVAVGGSAASLRRLVGAELAHQTLERSVRILSSTAVEDVARRFQLDPQRVRLLPAGIIIFDEVSSRLELPLAIANGGLREGVILELAAGKRSAEPGA